jgi:hypothetical protein
MIHDLLPPGWLKGVERGRVCRLELAIGSPAAASSRQSMNTRLKGSPWAIFLEDDPAFPAVVTVQPEILRVHRGDCGLYKDRID